MSSEHPFIIACEKGDMYTLKLLTSYNFEGTVLAGSYNNQLKDGLAIACKYGHIEIVKLFISKGLNSLNNGLINACSNGHMDIVKLLISHGANDFHKGFEFACCSGHIDIVNLLILKGVIDWNGWLFYACAGAKLDIANLMIEKGADDFYYCLKQIITYGNYPERASIIKMLIVRLGYIPHDIISLHEDMLYTLYKLKVKPSYFYVDYFHKLKIAEKEAYDILENELIKDIANIVISY